jgi:Ca2+-binding EF-hand superfamily protein
VLRLPNPAWVRIGSPFAALLGPIALTSLQRRNIMSRFLWAGLALGALLVGDAHAAGDKEKPPADLARHARVTITNIDAKKGEINVRYTDDKGQEQQKTFKLTRDVKLFDETGRVVTIDVFESGSDALILTAEGQLKELRRPAQAQPAQRLSDAVKTLIEMTDCEAGCVDEIQRIYDMLRKLDTGKNGKIDPAALKAERDRIVFERVNRVFDRLDVNKDGKISKDEARGLLKEHFNQVDRNGDGFISREELLDAAREKHAQKASQPEKK